MPNVRSTAVFRSGAVRGQNIELTIGDVYAPKVWVTQALFWPVQNHISFEKCYEALRAALSHTLRDVPALAGKIQRRSDDPRDLYIQVEASSSVVFVGEDVSTRAEIPSYEALKTTGFPLTALSEFLSPRVVFDPVTEGTPILAAKLSFLKGGAVLLIGLNHVFADGATIGEIQSIWAGYTAAGEHHPLVLPGQEHRQDEFRRRLSTPVSDTSAGRVFKYWKILPAQRSALSLPEQCATCDSRLPSRSLQDALRNADEEQDWCVWHFHADALARLKAFAFGANHSRSWISTIDALIGLFWVSMISAKHLDEQEDNQSIVFFPVNIRSRLNPPVDHDFHGNAVDMVAQSLTLRVLGEKDGIEVAARAVRDAILQWSEAEWLERLSISCRLPKEQALCPDADILVTEGNLGATDASKLTTLRTPWGPELGCPERLRYGMPVQNLPPNITILSIHPRLQDGALEVTASHTTSVMNELLSDPQFSSYAGLVCTYR